MIIALEILVHHRVTVMYRAPPYLLIEQVLKAVTFLVSLNRFQIGEHVYILSISSCANHPLALIDLSSLPVEIDFCTGMQPVGN